MARQIRSSSRLSSDSEIWLRSERRITLCESPLRWSLDPIVDFIHSFVPVYFEGDLTSGAPELTEQGKQAIEEMMKL